MTTLREVVESHTSFMQVPNEQRDALVAALMEREDQMADLLRMLGVQFGLYPEIVAKSLMDVGLGTPVPEATQQHINRNFAARMEWLRQQIEQHNRQQNGEDQ